MKKNLLVKRISNVLAMLALFITTCNVNSTCVFYVHQPEIPEKAEKLKKY